MPGWSELPRDLLVLIGKRINLIEDYLNLGTVCKSWRSVATKNNFNSDLPRVPWLMLAEEEDDSDSCCRKFFSLYNGMILKKRIPKASGKRCMESMGWLITIGKYEGEISLLHPFSGVQIELPRPKTTKKYLISDVTSRRFDLSPCPDVRKAVLSANPSHTSDYVLMMIHQGCEFLSFWRPGDSVLTKVVNPHRYSDFRDVVYYNGHFYAIDNTGNICVCDVDSPETIYRHILACVEDSEGHTREMEWQPPYDARFYILESLGSLFVVIQCDVALRYAHGDGDRIPLTRGGVRGGTTHFRVFHADLAAGRLRETRDLGDTAFFLGANTSLSVQATQFLRIKPNHIYFTDNCWDTCIKFKRGGGLDMGVFNLADGSILPHYKGVSLSRFWPPIWVTPTLR